MMSYRIFVAADIVVGGGFGSSICVVAVDTGVGTIVCGYDRGRVIRAYVIRVGVGGSSATCLFDVCVGNGAGGLV